MPDDIITNALDDIEPITRREQFLQDIADGENTLTPVTREEEFLSRIAAGGGGSGLPSITSEDEGKVLTVENGEAKWGDACCPLFIKVVRVNEYGFDQEEDAEVWVAETDTLPSELLACFSANQPKPVFFYCPYFTHEEPYFAYDPTISYMRYLQLLPVSNPRGLTASLENGQADLILKNDETSIVVTYYRFSAV